MNLAELLVEHPFADDEELLFGPDEVLTAGAARAAARDLAARLREAGLQPGEVVAAQLDDGPGVVVAMVGTWLADGVFVPVNQRLPASAVEDLLAETGAAFALDAEGLRSSGGTTQHEPGVAVVLWTSGTTSAPKPVLHTHDSYAELLDRVLGTLRGGASAADHPSPNLIAVSLSLNAGLYNALFGLRAGAALVILGRFDAAVFAERVRQFGIKSTVLPPAALTMLNDDPDIDDLSPLRYVRSITAPLSPLQARRFTDKFGVFVLNGYGQAEIGEVIGWTAADAREHPDKIGAVGRPHPGVDLRIVDEEGAEVGPGEVGELRVRPPSMSSGLADGSGFDDRLDGDGFLATGDLARLDADGFVWIEGRLGEVINRGGNKVFPADVEEVLLLASEVADAAVVGVPDDRLGEVPVAFVVPYPDGVEPTEGNLEDLCREHLIAYKVPVAFRVVSELPRTEVGKIRRSELAAGFEGIPG